MRFEKRKSCKNIFANHDFKEIKSCRQANHKNSNAKRGYSFLGVLNIEMICFA